MSIAAQGLKLELHRHGASHATDLTRYTLRVTDIHGRMQPYGGLDVDLDVPAAHWSRLPKPGDWLVLRDARTLRTLQVGAVASPDTGVDAVGARVETKVTQVSAHTWLDFLARPTVYTHNRDTVGTFISFGDYSELLKQAISLARDGKVGAILAAVAARLPNVLLPAGLGGTTLGRAIRVVYDDTTARQFTAGRMVEAVRGHTVRGPESVNAAWRGGVSVLQLLRSTFDHGSDLIEFFPSVERLQDLSAASIPTQVFEELSAQQMGLGANLALVFRISPWRAKPLEVQFVGGSPTNRGLDPGIVPNFWGGVTWRPDSARVVAAAEVVSVSHSQPDDNRINAVSADVMGAGEEWFTLVAESGLPIVDAADVKNHGMRLYNPRWPFFRETGTSVNSIVRTIAAQAAQFMLGAERFLTGSAQLNHLRRDIRHGEIVRFDLHATKVLTAYVDRVQHTVTANAAVEGQTTVFFSRGLYDERLRDVQVAIELPVVAAPRGTRQQSSPGNSIIFDGELLPIAWPNVRLHTHGDGLKLTTGFSANRRAASAIDEGVLHWDVTLNSKKTLGIFNGSSSTAPSGAGSHFLIDWDGTIYQILDMAYPAFHAGTNVVNNRSVGVDLNNPVYPAKNAQNTRNGQPARPTLTGWTVRGEPPSPDPFLGFHQVQIEAFQALAAALQVHLGIPLVSPAYSGVPRRLVTIPSLQGLATGWYHHAEVSGPPLTDSEGKPLASKVDTCGVDLPSVLAAAGPFPAGQSGV